jgi:hypothetical protein
MKKPKRNCTNGLLHVATHTHSASIGPLVHPTLRRRARKEEVLVAIKDAYYLVKITHSEGRSKICTGPEFTGPLWALVRGHTSQFALTRVRQYMIALDLSGDTVRGGRLQPGESVLRF